MIFHVPITTRRGRVIYDRKPHKFTAADLARIGRKVEPPRTEREAWTILDLLYDIVINTIRGVIFFLPFSQDVQIVLHGFGQFGVRVLEIVSTGFLGPSQRKTVDAAIALLSSL